MAVKVMWVSTYIFKAICYCALSTGALIVAVVRWHASIAFVGSGSCHVQECSQPSCESAGEVCWAPQAEACDQEQDLLRMGTECAAAVNLLSMTQSQSSLQQYVAGAPAFEATFAEPQVAPMLCAVLQKQYLLSA